MTFEDDLEAAANEELERACTLGWAQLASTRPGATPSRASRPAAGRSVLSAATCGKASRAAIFVSRSLFMSPAPTKRELG
jgi:hypothetical protein